MTTNPIPGVYLDESRAWNFKNSVSAITDYLNLKDTAALQNFMNNVLIKMILDIYLVKQQHHFSFISSDAIKKKHKTAKLKKVNL